MINDKNKIVAIPLLIILGAIGGYFAGKFAEIQIKKALPPIEIVQTREVRSGGYEFINPLLECDNFTPIKGGVLVNLESEIRAYITRVLNTNKAKHVSVYFRDLNNGPWIGINEDEKYSPSGLLKVPVAIAAMKKAETDPYFLQKRINYEKQGFADEERFKPEELICPENGQTYSVEELVKLMLSCSDKTAAKLLTDSIGTDLAGRVFTELGIKKKTPEGEKEDYVSVREYSSMFRLLFNATYLNEEKSNKVLALLSLPVHKDGLLKGLPPSVKVAHKFGDRILSDASARQVHDCGIIYLPGSPYLLCVMTRGNDQDELTSVISDISGIVYRKMEAVKK